MVPLTFDVGDRCRVLGFLDDHGLGKVRALSGTLATVELDDGITVDVPIRELDLDLPCERIDMGPKRVRNVVETDLYNPILAAVNRLPGVRMARNANVVMPDPETGRMFRRSGLGNGSPDLVGVMTLRRWLPFAFGLEVKLPGKTPDRTQLAWHASAAKKGMQVSTVTSVAEAVRSVHTIRAWYEARIAEVIA